MSGVPPKEIMNVQEQGAAFDKAIVGKTVATMFASTVRAMPDAVALRWKEGDAWREITWAETADQACRLAASLGALGVTRGDRVVMIMRNRPEFHVADLAVLLCGATPISIYNSSAPDQVQYLAGHCGAVVAIAEDADYLDRILQVRGELPNLRHVVVIDDPTGAAQSDILRWDDLLAAEPVDFATACEIAQPDDLATVIYTSGTTGPPKGVMLDHANICWTVETYAAMLRNDPTGWRVVSYLPMAHIAERMTSHYLGVARGFEITTCPDPGIVSQYLPQTRPNSFFAVPRVWEKFYAALQNALFADESKRAATEGALAIGWMASEYRARDEELPDDLAAKFAQADAALGAVRAMVGLDQLEIAVTGAAPIPFDVLKFFRSIGLPLSEIYGLSETSGPMTWEPYRVKVGSVGVACLGIEVKLADDGEVVCRGGNIFRGYLNAPDKTAEVLDADGWFHSGDIGEFDDEGYLKIVDRKKELIITAGGKNISPANLEAALKQGELIGQCCAIGDMRPFVSALVVLDPDVTPQWARARGVDGLTLEQLAVHPEVVAEIDREVAAANERFSNVEKIKKVTILHSEWLPDSEELTPTMKLKRRGVHTKFADAIEAMYTR